MMARIGLVMALAALVATVLTACPSVTRGDLEPFVESAREVENAVHQFTRDNTLRDDPVAQDVLRLRVTTHRRIVEVLANEPDPEE